MAGEQQRPSVVCKRSLSFILCSEGLQKYSEQGNNRKVLLQEDYTVRLLRNWRKGAKRITD